MSSADHAVMPLRPGGSVGAHRHTEPVARARTTRRWAVGVLAAATVALVGYLVVLLWMAWLLVSAFTGGTATGAPIDLLAVVADVAPVLLVGWCTGLAASAALSRGEATGPRVAGMASGLVGVVAGAAMLGLTDLL